MLGFEEGGSGGVRAWALEEGVKGAGRDVEGFFDQMDEGVGEGGEGIVIAERGVSARCVRWGGLSMSRA